MGSRLREPFNADEIHKDIIDINHVSGDAYGTSTPMVKAEYHF